jgi:hypothetical protein
VELFVDYSLEGNIQDYGLSLVLPLLLNVTKNPR